MSREEKTTGWHTTSDSASGVAHYWEKQKYSRRKSLCGRIAEAKMMQDASQTLSKCARCEKALAAKPTDPDTISRADRAKLIAVYNRLCPDDLVTDKDPRMPVIAAEVLDVGRAASVKDALEVISYWQQPAEWANEFVSSVRRAVARMKLP